jgi:rhodanese-related sulfurtransferase
MLKAPAELVGAAKATITECSIDDAKDCQNSDTLLIDVREAGEYRKGHLPGAVHLSRGLLEFEIHGLVEHLCPDNAGAAAEQSIVLYCGTGGRSALAAQSLESLGYKNVSSMAGGVAAWAAASLPLNSPAA